MFDANSRFKKHLWNLVTILRVARRRKWPIWRRYASLRFSTICNCKHKDRHNRKLLLLAWEFPPAVTGGVYRPLSFARYATEFGWNTLVVCGPSPEPISSAGYNLIRRLPQSVVVHRIVPDDGPHPWPLPNIDGGIMNAIAVYDSALELLKITQEEDDGIILASGPPFHNFVAGTWLARTLGWRLILDYRDEWTQSPHGFNRCDKANWRWENRSLKQADKVIFTTQSQIDHQTQVFPGLSRDKCLLIHNGWEPEDFINLGVTLKPNTKNLEFPIIISFFGNLGKWWEPEDFLETLSLCCDLVPNLHTEIEILFVGNKPPDIYNLLKTYKNKLPLRLIDHLPKSDACNMMRSTDILLLLNPTSLSRYIPGKLYEYIAAEKPILLYGEGGEMAAIVKDLESGEIVPRGDASALARSITTLSTMHQSGNVARSVWLKDKSRRNLALRLFNFLDNQ